MNSTQHLSCSCGETTWCLDTTAPGRHILCYCKDCQSFARHIRQAAILDQDGGTHIWHGIPTALHFTSTPQLACLRLSPKGLMRWYAACCGTPIANTLPRQTVPFLGAILPAPAEGLGPVDSRVNTDGSPARIKEHGLVAAVLALFARALVAAVQKKTQSVFFTPQGQPVVTPRILTLAERTAARGGHLP